MSLRDSIIKSICTAIEVGTPIAKKTISTLETAGYKAAKYNLENNINQSEESFERSLRVIERYEEKYNKK